MTKKTYPLTLEMETVNRLREIYPHLNLSGLVTSLLTTYLISKETGPITMPKAIPKYWFNISIDMYKRLLADPKLYKQGPTEPPYLVYMAFLKTRYPDVESHGP